MPPAKQNKKPNAKKGVSVKIQATPARISRHQEGPSLWAKRLQSMVFVAQPPGIINKDKSETEGNWGHTGYFLKDLDYFYNPNDSQWWEPHLMKDGFQHEKYTKYNRILTQRVNPLNSGPDVGDGLCYLISICIAKIVNKAFKKEGAEGVDKINDFLIKCTLSQLYDRYLDIK